MDLYPSAVDIGPVRSAWLHFIGLVGMTAHWIIWATASFGMSRPESILGYFIFAGYAVVILALWPGAVRSLVNPRRELGTAFRNDDPHRHT